MPSAAPPRPTRWLRRITLAMLVAGLAWWAVYELVRPQPRFRFLLPPGARVTDARWLGSWCAMRIQDQRPESDREDRTIFFDFIVNRLVNPPRRFNKSYSEKLFDSKSVRSLDHYIIEHGSLSPSTFQVFDSIAGTFVEHRFPENATLQLSEDNTTLFESTTLPLAPWTALSPAPFSVVPAALLMSCDAQRLCNYEIGFQLVQVRQLPSLAVTGRYALPPHTQVYTLKVSADGKLLLHGFNHVLHDYLQTNGGTEATPDITRPIPREIPNNLRMWKTLRWMFPESLESLREWTRTATNLDRYDKLQSELWVKTDLTGIWSDLGTDADIYNAHTGQKLYSTTFEKSGKPERYRCMSVQQDWAFIGRVDQRGTNESGDQIYNSDPDPVCALHLPSGRKVDARLLPEYYWMNKREFTPSNHSGEAIDICYFITDRVFTRQKNDSFEALILFCLKPDGTMQASKVSSEMQGSQIIPHTGQALVDKVWKIQMPPWLLEYAEESPWLKKLLRADRKTIVNAENNSTLWSFDLIDESSLTTETEYVPPIFLSQDKHLLFVPILLNQNPDQNVAHYRYDVYCLPLSTWLPRWPYLAAILTLISQGVPSLRFVVLTLRREDAAT